VGSAGRRRVLESFGEVRLVDRIERILVEVSG